eukprot:1373636-Pleurochrysis_carterae.AAC.2
MLDSRQCHNRAYKPPYTCTLYATWEVVMSAKLKSLARAVQSYASPASPKRRFLSSCSSASCPHSSAATCLLLSPCAHDEKVRARSTLAARCIRSRSAAVWSRSGMNHQLGGSRSRLARSASPRSVSGESRRSPEIGPWKGESSSGSAP